MCFFSPVSRFAPRGAAARNSKPCVTGGFKYFPLALCLVTTDSRTISKILPCTIYQMVLIKLDSSSREQSLHRKSSPRRRSRSRDSPKRGLSRRRSPSPRHSKASPSRHRTHPSRQQRSLSPGGHGPHLSRHRPSRDDNKRRALPDVIGDTSSKRSQGRSESSGSQRMRCER